MKHKLKIVPICLFVYLFIGLFAKANANELGLRVSPSLLQIKLQPPAETKSPITIENLSGKTVELNVHFLMFKESDDENGKIEYLPQEDQLANGTSINLSDLNPNQSFLNGKVQLLVDDLATNHLVLAPKQKKDLILQIVIPKNEPSSDYYFSVIFITTPSDQILKDLPVQNSVTQVNTGIAMNTLLSISPENKPKWEIEQFTTPNFSEKGPIQFTIKIYNNASNYISPKGKIVIRNLFGQIVDTINIGSFNALADSSRTLVDSGNNPRTIWNKKHLLGFYSAQLKLKLPENNQTITKTIYFTVLPIKEIIGIAIVLSLIIVTYKRVKKKMKA